MPNVPLRGDRAAHDDIGYPGLHASDLDAGTPVHHLPTATADQLPLWDGSKWVAVDKSSVGGGADLYFFLDGALASGQSVAPPIIAMRSITIASITAFVETKGTAGSTVVDVRLGETSIFPTSAKPTVAYDDVDGYDERVPDTTQVAKGAVLQLDIVQAATDAARLTVCIAISSSSTSGSGSMTDADTLDSFHASAFALVDHHHDADYAAIGHNHDATYAAIGHTHDGGSAGAFTDLTDVPSSYSGQGGKVVKVKSDATGLEFSTISGGSDTTAIHDDQSGEIAAIAEKTTPGDADLLLIEDASASNAKKKIQVANLLASYPKLAFESSLELGGRDWVSRTTGSTYLYTRVKLRVLRPFLLYRVLWDIATAGTYTLTILNGGFSTQYTFPTATITDRTADVEFSCASSPLFFMQGDTIYFHLTKGSNTVWDDHDDNTPLTYTSFLYAEMLYYNTTDFTSYSAVMKVEGRPANWVFDL